MLCRASADVNGKYGGKGMIRNGEREVNIGFLNRLNNDVDNEMWAGRVPLIIG